MSIFGPKNLSVLMFLWITALASSDKCKQTSNQGTKTQSAPVVVEVEKTSRGVAYKVDSKPTGSTPTTDLLHVLNKVNDERGSNTHVVVLIDPRVPIDQIWNVDGTAGKAQLTNLHYFVIDHDTEKMVEIKWGPAIPISMNPRVQ